MSYFCILICTQCVKLSDDDTKQIKTEVNAVKRSVFLRSDFKGYSPTMTKWDVD